VAGPVESQASSAAGRTTPGDIVRSVQRACRLLDAIARTPAPATAAELASATALNISTCYHLLNTLEVESLVVRGEDHRYRLGSQVLALAAAAPAGIPRLPELLGELDELNVRSRETAYLVAWQGSEIVVLAVRLGLEPVVAGDTRIGYTENAHARASGKAILAFTSAERVERYLRDHPLRPITARTVVEPRAFAAQLEEVRRRGFSVEAGEYAEGVTCVAAPILAADGAALGALSLSVPASRFRESSKLLADEVAVAARRASGLLGYRSDGRPGDEEVRDVH
jgi:DNA-binding IclR family transcriptional regulator